MEFIEYGSIAPNGDFISGAEFDVIQTLSYERTGVYDAAKNYLWTSHRALVQVNWQPSQISYVSTPDDPLTPLYAPGQLPGTTDLALLSYLLNARGVLRITAGKSVILETPSVIKGGGTRMPCDATGGPMIRAVGVPAMIGLRHWMVTLQIEADVRDQIQAISTDDNVVVSNLWVGTEDIDFQRRSVRRFAGRAILRADVMRTRNLNANSFRDLYLFACPDHYQRQNVSVQISEDGTICDWSFEDAMRGYDLGVGSPIVSIEAFVTGYIKGGSPAKAIIDTVRSAARAAGAGHPLDAAIGFPLAQFSAQLDNLPQYYIQARCDLVGDRCASLSFLTAIALGVCANQIATFSGVNDPLTGNTEIIFRQDVADQIYTSVEMTRKMSDDALVVAGLANPLRSPAQTLLLLQQIFGQNNLAVAALAPGSQWLQAVFTTSDSVQLKAGIAPQIRPIVPPNPGDTDAQIAVKATGVVADRSGTINGNPPFRQGAFGVIPANAVNPPAIQNTLGTVPGALGAIPTGSVPAGIQHLIVQALLGQGVTPPQPPTLVNDS